MSVYKRGNVYWINLYRPGKPRMQLSSGCKIEADALAIEATFRRAEHGNVTRARLIEALDNILGESNSSSIPLDRVWAVYTSLPMTAGASTLRIRRGRIRSLVEWCGEHWPAARTMAQVDRQCAFAYLEYLRAGTGTGKTHNNIRGDLSAVWQTLMVRAELPENVWKIMPTASLEDSSQRRAFTHAEEKTILAAAQKFPKWEQVCIIARYTGLRKSDILFLQRTDIDGDLLRLTPRKTARHKTRVVIPIHPRVREALDALPGEGAYLFPEIVDGPRSARETTFQRILKAAGVADEKYILDFHCWRHTFRTRLRDAGVSVEMCNRLGGWSDSGEGDRYDHALEPLRAAIAADTK